MIALDTNILIYANRRDSHWHGAARQVLNGLLTERKALAIPWPCITEFLAVMTRGDQTGVHMSPDQATAVVNDLVELAEANILIDLPGCWSLVQQLLEQTNVTGSRVYDLRIAAVCIQHSVPELLTIDSDMKRIPGIKAVNPFRNAQ